MGRVVGEGLYGTPRETPFPLLLGVQMGSYAHTGLHMGAALGPQLAGP